MKIAPTLASNRPTSTSGSDRATQDKTQKSTASTATLSADDITQAGLQTAQQTLNDSSQNDVDSDKVAQMQAALAAGQLQVDPDALAADMFSFFQK